MRRWITLWIVPAIAVVACLPQAARADTGATDGGITITIPAPLPTVTPPDPLQPPSADTNEMAAARNIWHNHTGYLDVARQTIGAYLVGENVAEAGTLDEADGLLM